MSRHRNDFGTHIEWCSCEGPDVSTGMGDVADPNDGSDQ